MLPLVPNNHTTTRMNTLYRSTLNNDARARRMEAMVVKYIQYPVDSFSTYESVLVLAAS
jgi:hypothetical protein